MSAQPARAEGGAAFIDVRVPARLYREVEEYIRDTEFTSVAAFVGYVLTEVMADDDAPAYASEAEEAKVAERLRALGYLE